MFSNAGTRIARLLGGAAAVAAAAGMAGAPALAAKKDQAQQQAPKYDLSDKVRTAIVAVQKATDAKDWATAATQLQAAQAALSTADDKYVTGNFQVQVGQNTQNNQLLAQGIDNMIASGKVAADKLPTLYSNQAGLASQAKDYAKAETALRQLNQLQPNDATTLSQLAQLATLQHHDADAATFSQQALAAAKASGQAPDQNLFLQQLQGAYSAKNNAAVVQAGIALLNAYPSAINWTKALQTFEATTSLTDDQLVDLWRLERETGAADGRSYALLADYAFNHGLPGEARTTIDQGMASHKLNDPNVAATRAKAAGQIAGDQAGLAASAARAKAAASGRAAMAVADDYLGYGQFEQAIALYQVALGKSGTDAAAANLRLGQAQALNGDKAAAKASLAKVTGPTQPIAQYWSTWVDHS